MSGSHHHCASSNSPASRRERLALWIALVLNAGMFAVEIWQGLAGDSTSLLADAADFLSDSLSYIVTLLVFSASLKTRSVAALSKALLMLIVAAIALWQGIINFTEGNIPDAHTMGWVGVCALGVNIVSALMLYASRDADSNMRSVWLCSRNDAINNVLILIAAYIVYLTESLWPDLLCAAFIAGLAISSALQIIRHARAEMKHNDTHAH